MGSQRSSCGSDQGALGAAIALGANLPSALGSSRQTLAAVRAPLRQVLEGRADRELLLNWSPLYRTVPVGGPAAQPDYLNAVLLVHGLGAPTLAAAQTLMVDLLALEQRFGRRRQERWGPRCLDLDLLWWGDLHCDSPALQLPHPRLRERAFVLAPLVALEPTLVPPAPLSLPSGRDRSVAALLSELLSQRPETPPQRLPPDPAWPE